MASVAPVAGQDVSIASSFTSTMSPDIKTYISQQNSEEKNICVELERIISTHLKKAESKTWHRHPVWFLDGNPIVGFSKLKDGIRLMFWSGRDFDEPSLVPGTGRFKDASILYISTNEIKEKDLKRMLKKSVEIQWDYKNIVKRKGKLVRLNKNTP